MIKLIVNYVWNKFGKILELFDHFLAIFFFSLKTHDFSEFFFENSKKALFDLWDLLWWVFHMFLALNKWFRPKNEGWKKSVPKMFKTAVTVVRKNIIFENSYWPWWKTYGQKWSYCSVRLNFTIITYSYVYVTEPCRDIKWPHFQSFLGPCTTCTSNDPVINREMLILDR